MKYKKILVVCPRYPYPVIGGDKLRISEVIKFLSKKNSIDLVSIGNLKMKVSYINKQFIYKNNFINQITNVIKSLLKKEPMQIGLYKIPEMKKKINSLSKNYDVIIFHLIRTNYYFPKNFKGKKILEMTDLISKNYDTIEKKLSNLNLLKYLYKYEKKRLNNYELKEAKKFDSIVFVNKKDLINSDISKNKNIQIIGNGTYTKKNIYLKDKIKNNIVFFGNINSLANRTACIDFIDNYLPVLKKKYPNLEFKILGNCSKILKFYFKYYKGVDITSNVTTLSQYCKNSLAGICNVEIQSGLQNKILDYTSIGLPVIINKTSNNFQFLNGKNILIYKNKLEFFLKIKKLISDKKLRDKISNVNFNKTKKYYNWSKILNHYSKLIK